MVRKKSNLKEIEDTIGGKETKGIKGLKRYKAMTTKDAQVIIKT